MATWLTAQEAADHVNGVRARFSEGYAGCTVRTIRSWVNRGHLQVEGRDARGHQLFTLAAVARAELATRDRALRLVGIGAVRSPDPPVENRPCASAST